MINDLTALRQAAQDRQPEQAQFLLKRIFLQMPFYRALAIAVERTHRHVAIFERYHPDAKWARQVLVQITALGTAPGDLPAEAMREFTTPGSANFVKAVFDLGHATRLSNQLEARIGYLVSAVVNATMAELAAYWYGERLEQWEQVRRNQFDPATGTFSDPEATSIAYAFWTDDEVARRDTAAWLAVADSVEEKLSRK